MLTIPPLSDVLAFSTTIPGYYSEVELAELYRLTVALPPHATIVELGVQYGRSASVFFQVAQCHPLQLHFVDNWSVNESDAAPTFARLWLRFPQVPFTLHAMTTNQALYNNWEIDLLHIDADHSEESVESDCRWLGVVRPGGVVVFHDYDRKDIDGIPTVFPGVKAAADRACHAWEFLGLHDTQAKWRKPA